MTSCVAVQVATSKPCQLSVLATNPTCILGLQLHCTSSTLSVLYQSDVEGQNHDRLCVRVASSEDGDQQVLGSLHTCIADDISLGQLDQMLQRFIDTKDPTQ